MPGMNPPADDVDRSHLRTEQRLEESMKLDTMPLDEAVELMQRQDHLAVEAVARQRPAIISAIERVTETLSKGGRLIYIGAGTSGRLGVLDAAECPPTFRTDPGMVLGLIAGGREAMFEAQEGVEDSVEQGKRALEEVGLAAVDLVMGIAAGGTTPFVRGALSYARNRGAQTIFLTCAQRLADEVPVDLVIRLETGAEVLTGSTRLKAATATRLVLGTISTLAMVRMGKVYENLMVDLKAANSKLRDRAARIIMTLTNLSRQDALELLRRADGQVKIALVMHRRRVDMAEAVEILRNCGGQLRPAFEQMNR